MQVHHSKDMSVHVSTYASYDFNTLTTLCGSYVADKTCISISRHNE
jgi:hypothetical protein